MGKLLVMLADQNSFEASSENGGILIREIADWNRLSPNPLVSIPMLAYNHEAWIAEAIEGVTRQETDFPIELITSDDCSTDNTRRIILDYQQRYPQLIRVLFPERNLGMRNNSQNVIKHCRGTYIAFCEGDDYWTDPTKLQRQIEALAANADAALCCHRVKTGDSIDGKDTIILPKDERPSINSIEDILPANWIPTCSIVVKREVLQQDRKWAQNLAFGDWPLQVTAATMGKICFIDRVMGFYRVHHRGSWSGRGNIRRLEDNLNFYKAVKSQTAIKTWSKIVKPKICDTRMRLAVEYINAGDKSQARREVWNLLKSDPKNAFTHPLDFFSCFLKVYQFDTLVRCLRRIKNCLP